MRKISYPVLALIVANVIWGASFPILKLALTNIPPFSFAFIRFLIASLILYPFAHKATAYSDLKNKWLWLYAFCGITINIMFFYLALEKTTSISATIIASTAPVMVLIGSALFLREHFQHRVVFGVTMALVGALTIIFQPMMKEGLGGELLGNLMMILATLGAVCSTIFGRKFLTPVNALGATFWACTIGCLSFLPLAWREFVKDPTWFASLNLNGWTGIAYASIFSTVIAYTAYDWALSKLQAHKTSVFTYLDPVATVVIAVPLLGEKITLPFVFGSLLIFVGILIAEKRLSWHPLQHLFESDRIQKS